MPLPHAKSKGKTREQRPWNTLGCVLRPWQGSGRSRDPAGSSGTSWLCCREAAALQHTADVHRKTSESRFYFSCSLNYKGEIFI